MNENAAAAAGPTAAINPCGACPVRGLAVCGVLEPDELHALAEIVHEVQLTGSR
jgi:CRP/FNR family transcriptional regulator